MRERKKERKRQKMNQSAIDLWMRKRISRRKGANETVNQRERERAFFMHFITQGGKRERERERKRDKEREIPSSSLYRMRKAKGMGGAVLRV